MFQAMACHHVGSVQQWHEFHTWLDYAANRTIILLSLRGVRATKHSKPNPSLRGVAEAFFLDCFGHTSQ